MSNKYRQKTKKKSLNTKSVRNNIIYVLIGSIIFTSSIMILSPSDKKVLVSDVIEPIAAAVAAGLSLLVIYRQKTDGLMGKAFTLLGAGLVLFLTAEIIWSYYEIGLKIENPFPSIADALWLIAYGPLFYFIIKMYRFLGASHSKTHQLLVSVGSAAFFVYLIGCISQTSDFTTQDGITSFLVAIFYPILDALLLIPAALIMLNPVKGELTTVPWIFLAVLIMSIGDSMFAYGSNFSGFQTMGWIWDIFFVTSYFIASAGLYWHNRFFIYNNKKTSREQNTERRRSDQFANDGLLHF
jgi:diguanylate cyclase